MAIPLLKVACPTKRLLADKASDADSLRDWPGKARIEAVTPSPRARKKPYPLHHKAYRGRNFIERVFGRLNDWRRIATQYDRLATNYPAAVALVSSVTASI